MKKLKLFAIFLPFFLSLLSCAKPGDYSEPSNKNNHVFYQAKILSVVDGDTVKIKFLDEIPEGCARKETVRLIGVNTPELNLHKPSEAEYYAQEAYEFTNTFYQKDVKIELDDISALRDKYSRLLAYVHLNNKTILNKLLIEEGYGRYYDAFKFNKKYMKDFEKAELSANLKKKGMWRE